MKTKKNFPDDYALKQEDVYRHGMFLFIITETRMKANENEWELSEILHGSSGICLRFVIYTFIMPW